MSKTLTDRAAQHILQLFVCKKEKDRDFGLTRPEEVSLLMIIRCSEFKVHPDLVC